MYWILLANTGNYPATNYVNQGMILAVLLISIIGIRGILRGTRKEEAE